MTSNSVHVPDQRLRMRAAVTMLNSDRFNARTKLIAFLSIQHPELKPDKIIALANSAYDDRSKP